MDGMNRVAFILMSLLLLAPVPTRTWAQSNNLSCNFSCSDAVIKAQFNQNFKKINGKAICADPSEDLSGRDLASGLIYLENSKTPLNTEKNPSLALVKEALRVEGLKFYKGVKNPPASIRHLKSLSTDPDACFKRVKDDQSELKPGDLVMVGNEVAFIAGPKTKQAAKDPFGLDQSLKKIQKPDGGQDLDIAELKNELYRVSESLDDELIKKRQSHPKKEFLNPFIFSQRKVWPYIKHLNEPNQYPEVEKPSDDDWHLISKLLCNDWMADSKEFRVDVTHISAHSKSSKDAAQNEAITESVSAAYGNTNGGAMLTFFTNYAKSQCTAQVYKKMSERFGLNRSYTEKLPAQALVLRNHPKISGCAEPCRNCVGHEYKPATEGESN